MKDKTYIKYCVAGAAAGAINGFLGAGGGMILIPLLVSWIKLDERRAFATSVCILAPISLVSSVSYFFSGNLDFMLALPYIVSGFIGGYFGGRFLKTINIKYVRKAFAVMLIYGGIRSLILW